MHGKVSILVVDAPKSKGDQNMTEKQVFKTTWAGKDLTIEVGQMAKQANGAALIRFGDTVVLTAAVGSRKPRPGDFFPLTVNYEEKNVCGR